MFQIKKRKIVVLLLACFCLMGTAAAANSESGFFKAYQPRLSKPVKKNPRILMIGNSHTHVNNMPAMLKKICSSGGIKAHIETYTIGGHTLYQWAYPKTAQDKKFSQRLFKTLKTKKWDYVVLQGGTIETVVGAKKMSAAVQKLMPMIRKSKAKVVFYQTWAPQNGHHFYRKYSSIVSGVADFQSKVVKKYNSLAKKYKAAVAPAGIAFRRAEKLLLDVPLYSFDKKHASRAGSYLAACTLYSTMFRRKASGKVSLADSIERSEVSEKKIIRELQQIAADVTIHAKKPNNAKIKLNEVKQKIAVNTSFKMSYKITGKTANTRISSWNSSDSRVATVSDSGIVKIHAAGQAVITVVLNNGKSASCTINVK